MKILSLRSRMTGSRGFTLIELMVSITILAIIVTSGINLFFRSIRDSSRSELSKIVDERSRIVTGSLTRYLREAKIESLSGVNRATCLTSGAVTGNSLVALDPYGIQSTFSLNAGKLASGSAIGGTLYLNPETAITVAVQSAPTPLFTWYCTAGAQDRISIKFKLTAVGEGGSGTVFNDYGLDVTLRNTGQ